MQTVKILIVVLMAGIGAGVGIVYKPELITPGPATVVEPVVVFEAEPEPRDVVFEQLLAVGVDSLRVVSAYPGGGYLVEIEVRGRKTFVDLTMPQIAALTP